MGYCCHVPALFTQKRLQPTVEGRQGRFICVGGSQPKSGLAGSCTGALCSLRVKKKLIFMAVISLDEILFDSLIFLYITKETFPFTTNGNFTNGNVVLLAAF